MNNWQRVPGCELLACTHGVRVHSSLNQCELILPNARRHNPGPAAALASAPRSAAAAVVSDAVHALEHVTAAYAAERVSGLQADSAQCLRCTDTDRAHIRRAAAQASRIRARFRQRCRRSNRLSTREHVRRMSAETVTASAQQTRALWAVPPCRCSFAMTTSQCKSMQYT